MSRLPSILAFVLASLLVSAAPVIADGQGKAGEGPSGPIYLRLDRIVVPVIRDGAVERHLTFVLALELADDGARMRAKMLLPRLTDAFVRDLHILASRPSGDDGFDLAIAKRHLLAASMRLLGADAVKDVLIQRSISRQVN